MAAGIVYHDITTASGVTFSLACWVPNTAAPDVGAIPVSLPIKSDGTVADATVLGASTGAAVSTDAAGTIQQYLRGIVKLIVAKITVLVSDGTNTAAVKAASIPPAATDPALVVSISPNSVNLNGQAPLANSSPVAPASDWIYNKGYYVAVAASQTDSVLQASAGASGDYLHEVTVIPASTAPGVVTIKDSATTIIAYPGGGTTALLTLTPFTIFVGAYSRSGAWKITTGANVSVKATGRFS